MRDEMMMDDVIVRFPYRGDTVTIVDGPSVSFIGLN